MKKYLSIIIVALIFLAGCDTIDRAVKGDKYVDARIAQKKAEDTLKKLNKSHFPQLSNKVAKDEAKVKIATSKGDITLKLFPKYAPLAVENFLTHAKNGYYNNLTFHRVIADFMIQGGDPKGDGSGGESIWKGKDKRKDSGQGFANEISNKLYNLRGALGMANRGKNTNGSQFYIVQNHKNVSKQLNPKLYPQKIINAYKKGGYPSGDRQYTIFGQVIKGMNIIDDISKVKVDNKGKPQEKVIIKHITIIKNGKFK
ncbi:peptidylprolyl isomerase [Streptococcus macacae]|uniref:Peptidyl-prolyl cis-trans isomerase n=1 Tax=Streptococcus macacae NCTC 11558 TaxID=764298 RepID=G5JYG1_9STRE|nr:peptidylprolyl isomerase [Streptococcus macacae]EHJ52388.1 peptidyl-prolyl cis-trans isomerase, cyclophilin-type [Streptococcus macacae NCTC 11558]SUN78074.1 peptidyl-prolyl cis-trans isomerase [Streptococcus macacae NCTC 11558]